MKKEEKKDQAPLLSWSEKGSGNGVVVAANGTQEWLLKWWWDHYSKKSDFPVTFFDLGMSKSARNFCESKGSVRSFTFPKGMIKTKEAISQKNIESWENTYPGDVWVGREQWFTKPFILLKSPYETTVWMDLDCEVLKPIDPLFDYANGGDGFSILQFHKDNANYYNTGVIVAKHGSKVPLKWAEQTQKRNEHHFGDETVLMEMLEHENLKITPHPLPYNCPTILPMHEDAVIRHYIGAQGKIQILRNL